MVVIGAVMAAAALGLVPTAGLLLPESRIEFAQAQIAEMMSLTK